MTILSTSPTILCELPADVAASRIAYVQSWRVGKGSAPTTATIRLPDTRVADRDWADGVAVNLWQDSRCVFRGHVYVDDNLLSGGQDEVTLVAYDVRQAMRRKQLGQYGVGPIGTVGGWPGVGYDLVFNRDGRPNRSTAVDGTGFYTFDSTATAQFWTYQQILEFIWYWYVDSAVAAITTGSLSVSPLTSAAPEIPANVGDPAMLTDRVMKTLGGSWTIDHSGDYGGVTSSAFRPILASIAAPTTRAVTVATADTVITPGAYSGTNLQVRRSTLNNYDRVEVHSAPYVVETSYYDSTWSATNPLLTRVASAADLPKDAALYFAVDVTQYSYHLLGSNLPAGSKAKPWLPKLVTRRTASAYVTAGQPLTEGDDVPCRETIWITLDGGTNWRRVKDGVKLDMKLGRIYVQREGATYGSRGNTTRAWRRVVPADVGILATIATVVSDRVEVEGTSATGYLTNTRTRRIVRRDLVPLIRYQSYLPDVSSADANARTQVAASALEVYHNVIPTLQTLRDQIYAARTAVAIDCAMTLPFLPEIDHGDAITVSPLSLGLTDLRVTDITVNAIAKAMNVRCTNNPDFA